MATGNAPRGFPGSCSGFSAGLMLIIGLAMGILGAKLALVGGTLYFALMGVVSGHRGGVDFPQPPRRYSVIRRGVYRLGDLGD